MDRVLTGWKQILAGVSQGSTLSPKLYNLYTPDLPKFLQTELSVYADGSYIYHINMRPCTFGFIESRQRDREVGQPTAHRH